MTSPTTPRDAIAGHPTERRYITDMRQRLGLEEDDNSKDARIEAMTARQRLGLIAGWNLGYSGWENNILSWVRDAGFIVKDPADDR